MQGKLHAAPFPAAVNQHVSPPPCSPRLNPGWSDRRRRSHNLNLVRDIQSFTCQSMYEEEDCAYAEKSNSAMIGQLNLQVLHLRHQLAELSGSNLSRSPASIFYQRKLTKEDYDCLPHRLILLRHAESHGNVNHNTYCTQPDHTAWPGRCTAQDLAGVVPDVQTWRTATAVSCAEQVSLTSKGRHDALAMGGRLRDMLKEWHGPNFRVFFMTSPYCRTLQTTDLLLESFTDEQVAGVRQAVQLREQDFGNFQDSDMSANMTDRQRFGRFYYRFPNGESGADVYDRLTIFEDHMTRDMLLGRFAGTSMALVTHGLTLRIFLMRWFHWSVDEFLEVFNPDNCVPIVVEKLAWEDVQKLQYKKYAHAKHLYAITPESRAALRGCTEDMSSYFARNRVTASPRQKWRAHRRGKASYGLYNSTPLAGREAGPLPNNYASFSFQSSTDEDEDPWSASMPQDIAEHIARSKALASHDEAQQIAEAQRTGTWPGAP